MAIDHFLWTVAREVVRIVAVKLASDRCTLVASSLAARTQLLSAASTFAAGRHFWKKVVVPEVDVARIVGALPKVVDVDTKAPIKSDELSRRLVVKLVLTV